MKQWKINEFMAECASLCWTPYTYDYSRMPEGICNGHTVKPYDGSWHSIVIDGAICNMDKFDETHPNGYCGYGYNGQHMTALEYVVARLLEPAPERK